MRLCELFHLSALEKGLLTRLAEAEAEAAAPPSVAAVAAQLGVRVSELVPLLAGTAPLRAHALVEVEERAELGLLRADDLLRAARGLLPWWTTGVLEGAQSGALIEGQAPGVRFLPAPPADTAWALELLGEKPPAVVLELVRNTLVAPHPVLLWLSGCSAELLEGLTQAVRQRLQRPVLCIDGAALGCFPGPQVYAALRRLRRDADLRGAAVIVSEAPQLGAAWRALCEPRPAGHTAPVVLVGTGALAPLGQPGKPFSGRAAAPLVPQTLTMRSAPPPAPASAPAGTPAETQPEDPTVVASRDEARRRAALDAAKAMGRPIPRDLAEPPRPAATAPTPAPAATPVAPAAPAGPVPVAVRMAAATASPAPPAPAPAPAAAPPPGPGELTPPGVRKTNPRLAAALAKAGLPPAGSGAQSVVPLAAREAPPEAPARPAAPAPPPPAAPEAPTAAASGEAPESEAAPPDEQPPVPVADDATLDDLIRIARTTPSATQRAELLRRLAGTRAPAVIQLFRTNVTSAHPGVRAAAEAGMVSLFGPNWNRTRPIAPPVQPPRSDDNGRGPGGAF